jgi:hypothetical protein
MNAREARAAVKAIPYPNDAASNSEYAVALDAYNEAKTKVINEFRQWLASEYAPSFPKAVQDKIWAKSWNVPGRSYFDVEIAYTNNAEFAKFARDTK